MSRTLEPAGPGAPRPDRAGSFDAWRREFPLVERTTYLVSHSLGAMPRRARAALERYAREWDERGVRAWSEGWWESPVTAGDRLAPLIGAPPGSVSLHPNVTLAQAIFLSCFDWSGRRNRLVCTDLDFPSCLYLYDGLAERGAEIVRVPGEPGGAVDPDRLAAAVDERTAVVAFSHVLYRNAAIVDPAPVVAKARAAGAVTLLDAYQSVGTLPIDVTALGVDALTGGSVKWLCGGPGAGYLYVRPESAPRLTPRLTGWMAHPEPFAFDPGPMTPVAGPFRYLNGTPNVPGVWAASAGYEILGEIGIEAVRARSLALTGRLIEAARERGWTVLTPLEAERRGGSVSLAVPEAERVAAALAAREVIVDWRPEVGVRLGPHFYNREEDVDRAVAELEVVLRAHP